MRPTTAAKPELDPYLGVTPRPGKTVEIPTGDEFASWCHHPVTQFVAHCHQVAADKQKDAWEEISWNAGSANLELLIELKTRADAYLAFLQTRREQYVDIIGQ